MRHSAPLLVLALLLASCMPQQPDMAALRKTIDEFDAASVDAMMSGNMETLMSYYADDAMSMPPNMGTLKGKAAIESWMNDMAQSGMKMTSVEFGTTELDASGTIAYLLGTYDMAMEMPGMGEMKDAGKYISIWKKQADGSWKVHAEIWNSDRPIPGMEMGMGMEKK